MKTASIAELKARLSEFLAGIAAGDVVITDRGRPVARLSALPADAADARIEELTRAGLVRPPRRARTGRRKLPTVRDNKGLMLRALLDEREGGR